MKKGRRYWKLELKLKQTVPMIIPILVQEEMLIINELLLL